MEPKLCSWHCRSEASDPLIENLVAPQTQIREFSWRAMNSFVHGGIHSMQRTSEGFPLEHADQTIRQSNGMLYFAFRMIVRFGDSVEVFHAMERAHVGYEDCLPMD